MTRKAIVGMVRAAALAAAFFLAGGAIPFAGALLMMFAPGPILGYAVGRDGALWRALAAAAVATGLVALAGGPMAGLGYVASFGIATLIICWGLTRQWRFELIVVATTGVLAVLGVAGALIITGSPAVLIKDLHDTLLAAMTRSEQFYRMFGMESGIEPAAREKIVNLTVQLAPALSLMAVALMVLFNLLVFWRWMGKTRLAYPLFADLVRWHSPDWLIWVFLAAGFALFAPIVSVQTLAINSFVSVGAVYFCQGLAVVAFYLRMLAMPSAVRGVLYLVTIMQPVLASIVCAVGVFDMWVDFRRLKPRSPEAGSFGDFM